MATLSQTVSPMIRVIEKEITMPTSTGTATGNIAIPANCVVIGAYAVVTEASAGASAHTFDISVGASDIATALDFFAASLGDILVEAFVPVATKVADTVDIVSTVTGTGTAGKVRLHILVVDANSVGIADEVDRDQLA